MPICVFLSPMFQAPNCAAVRSRRDWASFAATHRPGTPARPPGSRRRWLAAAVGLDEGRPSRTPTSKPPGSLPACLPAVSGSGHTRRANAQAPGPKPVRSASLCGCVSRRARACWVPACWRQHDWRGDPGGPPVEWWAGGLGAGGGAA